MLVVCGNEECGNTMARIIKNGDIETTCCQCLRDTRSFLLRQTFIAVFCSDSLPDGNFRSVIGTAGSTPVIVF